MSPLVEDRLEALARIPLESGAHDSFEAGVCAMEMVAYLAGEPHSDAPRCACPVLTRFVVAWNDGLPSDAERDRLLKPFLPRLIGTRASPAVEERRAFLAMDWVIRTYTPTWLDRVEALQPHAAAIRALDVVHNLATLVASQDALRAGASAAGDAARRAEKTHAAWAAAWDAARAAAWDAAWDAARAAAWDAAWDAARDAAWDAAWDAARDAARDKGYEAAAAKLRPTKESLQASAFELLDRLIDMRDAA